MTRYLRNEWHSHQPLLYNVYCYAETEHLVNISKGQPCLCDYLNMQM